MKEPKVLIYIPCHNYREFAKDCLDSAVSQTYSNMEIVVSFNGCTDGVDKFVKENYPQVKTLDYPVFNELGNPGINDYLRMSDCEIYVQLMMDDKLEPNFWEQVLPYFTSNDIGFVRIGCYEFNEERPEGSWLRPPPLNNPLEILVGNLVFVFSPTRKVVWESVGDHDIKIPVFGDWDFWIRTILYGWKWTTCWKPLYWLRVHKKSESRSFNRTREGPAFTAMRNKWMPTLRKYNITKTSMATSEAILEGTEPTTHGIY